MDNSKMKTVYVINEHGDRNYWRKIGIAFVNSDGSLNVKLDAIPISGEMHIRDYTPRDEVAAGKTRKDAKTARAESTIV